MELLPKFRLYRRLSQKKMYRFIEKNIKFSLIYQWDRLESKMHQCQVKTLFANVIELPKTDLKGLNK